MTPPVLSLLPFKIRSPVSNPIKKRLLRHTCLTASCWCCWFAVLLLWQEHAKGARNSKDKQLLGGRHSMAPKALIKKWQGLRWKRSELSKDALALDPEVWTDIAAQAANRKYTTLSLYHICTNTNTCIVVCRFCSSTLIMNLLH